MGMTNAMPTQVYRQAPTAKHNRSHTPAGGSYQVRFAGKNIGSFLSGKTIGIKIHLIVNESKLLRHILSLPKRWRGNSWYN